MLLSWNRKFQRTQHFGGQTCRKSRIWVRNQPKRFLTSRTWTFTPNINDKSWWTQTTIPSFTDLRILWLDVREKLCWFNPQITGAWPTLAAGSIPVSSLGTWFWCMPNPRYSTVNIANPTYDARCCGIGPSSIEDLERRWCHLGSFKDPPEIYPETMAY